MRRLQICIWLLLGFSGKAQVFSEFEHSTSILAHLNPAATGIDSTINFTTAYRNFQNLAASQVAMVEGFSGRFNGGFSLQYFNQEMDMARFRNIRGAYAFHMNYKSFKAHYGFGLSVSSRSPKGVSTSPFFSKGDPDSTANFFRLHFGAMIFHKNLEMGFAYHPFVGDSENLKLAHSTPLMAHFGFSHKFNGAISMRPYVALSMESQTSNWIVNLPFQYGWFKAGFAISSRFNTGFMLGINRNFLNISYYFNKEPPVYPMGANAPYLHEIVFTISFRNAKRYNPHMRRVGLM